MIDGRPVIALQETAAFATGYDGTIESAPDTVRMYDVIDTDASNRMEHSISPDSDTEAL